jgi:hypothetical protein
MAGEVDFCYNNLMTIEEFKNNVKMKRKYSKLLKLEKMTQGIFKCLKKKDEVIL